MDRLSDANQSNVDTRKSVVLLCIRLRLADKRLLQLLIDERCAGNAEENLGDMRHIDETRFCSLS